MTVNLLALLLAVYFIGGVATYVWFMAAAPDEDVPGLATRRVIAVRSAMLSVLWPGTLLLIAAAEVFPRLGDWIENGSGK